MQPDESAPAPRAGLVERITVACHDLRGHRLPWLAIAFGTGVGTYFALPVEPDLAGVSVLLGLLVGAGVLAWTTRVTVGFVPTLFAVALAGLLGAQLRSATVSGPVLPFRYYGAIEGRIVKVDRSASGAPRLTLDRVRLDRMSPDETPRRVRVSLQDLSGTEPRPGLRVMTTGHLSPPAGPTEPGGFDFQRHAWFLKLGAVGYGRVPLLLAEPPEGDLGTLVARVRAFIGDGLRARLPGQTGEVAAAITTGDRAGLSAEVTDALRASNLAHLLAISGLHMGLLVGFVFWAVRGGLALFPRIALHHSTRVWAATVALPFALAYLFLSGGTVATQRAFVMAAVMLGAIILGARALSIRSVAIAAILILAFRPESLTGPGFQMSFAATAALVLAFGTLARGPRAGLMRGWKGAFLSLLLSSIVAGAATAPFAAFHFGRVGQYGVLANLLAVPMMGFAVMPLLFIGLMLWPLGLEWLPLRVAGWGIEWILAVARHVADLPGAVSAIASPSWHVLPLMGLGAAILGAARGRASVASGLAFAMIAGGLWITADRPAVLISDTARLVGVLGPEGRWLSRESGSAFVAESWLENDGDLASQEAAAGRAIAGTRLGPIHVIRGKRDLPAGVKACARAPGWLVSPEPVPDPPPGCEVFDGPRLERTGAVAIRSRNGVLELVTARENQGDRPWSPRER